jgi:hypothetical protein
LEVEPLVEPQPTVARPGPASVTARTTEKYVKRVTRLVNDISSGARASNLREQLLWTDRCAKTILRMSTERVAPDVAEVGREVAYDLWEIVSTFRYAADTVHSRSAAVNRPPIEWWTELIPYSDYKTPFGWFFRYAPFSYAQINIRGNVMRRQQITLEELSKANRTANDILTSVEQKVQRMNEMVGR